MTTTAGNKGHYTSLSIEGMNGYNSIEMIPTEGRLKSNRIELGTLIIIAKQKEVRFGSKRALEALSDSLFDFFSFSPHLSPFRVFSFSLLFPSMCYFPPPNNGSDSG